MEQFQKMFLEEKQRQLQTIDQTLMSFQQKFEKDCLILDSAQGDYSLRVQQIIDEYLTKAQNLEEIFKNIDNNLEVVNELERKVKLHKQQ